MISHRRSDASNLGGDRMDDIGRAEMYKRQLGGANAALRRARRELESLKRTCTMERTYIGDPCSDWTCSACGKKHVVHNMARLGEYCPRCGAKVEKVVR